MRDGLKKNLRSIFAGEDPILVTDDPALAQWLVTHDLEATTFDTLLAGEHMPSGIAAMAVDYERLPPRRVIRERFAQTSVLWLPFASFSSDLDTAKYGVEMFAASDVTQSVAMNRRIATRLLLAPETVTMSGPGTALTLRLPDPLQLTARTRLSLLPDEHSSIGNYFEVALSPTDLSGRVDDEMSLSGSFRIDAVLVAKHREIRSSKAAAFTAATRFTDELRDAFPLHVSIRDNRIVDGLGPWAGRLSEMIGTGYGSADAMSLTEIGIGTAGLPLDRVNWRLNCHLNEGATGLHLGIGDALTGMHFDFISREARFDDL